MLTIMMCPASKSLALLFVTFYCIPFLTLIFGADYHTKLLLLHLLAHFIAKLHNDVNFRKIIIINYLSIYFSFPKECFNMYFHVCQCLGYQSEVDEVMCFNNIFSKVLLCMYVIS